MKKLIIGYLFTLLQITLSAQVRNSYNDEIDKWFQQRYTALKKEDGWLNLVGLYWLEQGKNTLGTNEQNKLVFPKDFGVPFVGYVELINNNVILEVNKNIPLKVNGKQLEHPVIFSVDSNINATVSYKSFHWRVIKREDKIGIRLRNNNAPLVKNFKSINRFKTDANWRITASFQAPLFPSTIPIKNVIGQTVQMKLLGKLIFTIGGKIYSLDAVEEGEELFVIFGDATNSSSTYGAGRFLLVDKPNADGKTFIDFNKAYNPPCAFTKFATCPLPPLQNILPISVTAGEKKYGH